MPLLNQCVFCDIIQGRSEAYRIDENDLSLAILDIHPYTRGHCLVIPKRHVPWWHDMTPDETRSLFDLARGVANRMMEVLRPDFVFLYARGRRIPHTHLFLIPTFPGDILDRFFNALELFQESPEALARIKDEQNMAATAAMLRKP